MALFGSDRDASLVRRLNRELMGDIVTQQCAVYKIDLTKTRENVYGESFGEKFYSQPTLFNVRIDRGDQNYTTDDFGVRFTREVTFMFLRDDLVDASVHVDTGDIILFEEAYYEVESVVDNQQWVGKNPDYPNETNPLNPGLGKFGYDVSFICKGVYVPADKVGISKERYNG